MSEVLEERRLAQRLYDSVNQLKASSEESAKYRYNQILSRIEILIEYYRRMADALDYVGDEAVMLYRESTGLLQSDTDSARHVVSGTFL